MLLEYVLIIGIDYKEQSYAGHFIDCPHAFVYAKEHYPDQSHSCFYQDYIYLPADLDKKFFYPPSKD